MLLWMLVWLCLVPPSRHDLVASDALHPIGQLPGWQEGILQEPVDNGRRNMGRWNDGYDIKDIKDIGYPNMSSTLFKFTGFFMFLLNHSCILVAYRCLQHSVQITGSFIFCVHCPGLFTCSNRVLARHWIYMDLRWIHIGSTLHWLGV